MYWFSSALKACSEQFDITHLHLAQLKKNVSNSRGRRKYGYTRQLVLQCTLARYKVSFQNHKGECGMGTVNHRSVANNYQHFPLGLSQDPDHAMGVMRCEISVLPLQILNSFVGISRETIKLISQFHF